MDAPEEYRICFGCLTTTSKYLLECCHCQFNFCYECLLEHQHVDIYNRLLKQIQDIDTIVARFVDHAHSQTEWVGHLTQDRADLQIFVRYIQETLSYMTVIHLPTELWLKHVDDLIKNDWFAIDENCYWLFNDPKIQTPDRKKSKKSNKKTIKYIRSSISDT